MLCNATPTVKPIKRPEPIVEFFSILKNIAVKSGWRLRLMRLFLCYAVINEASGQVILAMQGRASWSREVGLEVLGEIP